MTTHRLSTPIPLVAPWPMRLARALWRGLAEWRPVRQPPIAPADDAIAEWDPRMLDDIGAPPEWRRAAESARALRELERASWRMHGMHAPLGSNRF